MKTVVSALVLALALFGLASCSALLSPGTALAYEFSEHERQVESDGRQQRLQSRQQIDRSMQAERQQQDQRWQREQKQFDPRAYDPPAPYNMFDRDGMASVCRRGANGAVFCQ